MKRKYYLIDTENVGDRWIEFISHLKEGEILIVFYTKNHSKLLEEYYLKQRYNRQIRWVECITGNNALDQQLTGVLSYLIATHFDAEYTIYSNDKGYKNVAEFWKQRNLKVERVEFDTDKKKSEDIDKKKNKDAKMDSADLLNKQEEEKQEEILSKEDEQVLEIENLSRIAKEPVEPIILEIAKAVPVSNLAGWYMTLVSLLGQDLGREYYIHLKENEEYKQGLSQYLLPDVNRRNIYLITLFYQHNHLDTEKATQAYRIVKVHNRKNKKAIKEDFDKYFGKKTKEQTQYYKVIKPILATLKGK